MNDIIQNLHGVISRTNAIKALDNLVQGKKIQCKTFGKISIYLRKEIALEGAGPSHECNFKKIQELKDEVSQLKTEMKDWRSKLDLFLNEPTNSELDYAVSKLQKDLETLEQNVSAWKQDSTSTDQTTIEWIQKCRKILDREVRQRKRFLKSCIQLLKHAIQPKNYRALLVCQNVIT